MKVVLAPICLIIQFALIAPIAQAQSRDDRDARGLRTGSFMIFPSITFEQGVDTNYFLAPLHRQSTYLTHPVFQMNRA